MTVTTTPTSSGVVLTPKKRTFKKFFNDTGWRHLVGIAVGIYAVFPILYVLSNALSPTGTLTGSNKLFQAFSLAGFERVLSNPDKPFGAWFMNTMIIGGVVAFGTILMGGLAAYAFSRMRFSGRRVGLLSLLLIQMFPQVLAVIAIFLLLGAIGDVFPVLGLNTRTGLIMVYLGGALGVNTYLMYGFFNTVPTSIDEAARIDGAGHARIFFTIIVRLVFPILIVVGILSFIAVTGDFVVASVVLSEPDTKTLAVGLYEIIANDRAADWGAFSAGAVMAALPVLILFMALQKYIISGLTAGAVK
ncbi:sugar ABC transporter permease [Lysinibacter cavernae]|uniref:Arabinogalactan oligomer/maltooligosaccharide transport system permease protein n=1 Tax=Lysinibacter cavernae TaxID=1640652 RepID=A0A7X5TTP2_9MICO|nr:sugar ABC transporter permease [Lysinibacter cavernae]NIH54415.1 arabinogalactan oligomer/maltooligosaccharide transport system permease protein [Lysinibacter cavernae]